MFRVSWWFSGQGIDQVTTRNMIIYVGWQTYLITLARAPLERSPSTLGPGWTGSPAALRLDPHEMPSRATFHVGWFTLTGDVTVTAGSPFQIVYQTTPTTGVSLTFYYDTDTNPANGRTAMGNCAAGQQQGPNKAFVRRVLGDIPGLDPHRRKLQPETPVPPSKLLNQWASAS